MARVRQEAQRGVEERQSRASGRSGASVWSSSAVVEEANHGMFMDAKTMSQRSSSAWAAEHRRLGHRSAATQGEESCECGETIGGGED